VGGAGQDFWERLRDANQFMFCGLQYRILRRLGGAPLHALVTKNKTQTHQLMNEAQLNCVALRSSLDYEVAWKAVKGQAECPKKARLTALDATLAVAPTSEKKIIGEGRPSALTFTTFS